MDLTPAKKIGNEVYEQWRVTPDRDAYVAAMVAEAARRAYQAGYGQGRDDEAAGKDMP